MCWLAISPPLKGEGTKSAEGCPRRWCKPAASPSVVVVGCWLLVVGCWLLVVVVVVGWLVVVVVVSSSSLKYDPE